MDLAAVCESVSPASYGSIVVKVEAMPTVISFAESAELAPAVMMPARASARREACMVFIGVVPFECF